MAVDTICQSKAANVIASVYTSTDYKIVELLKLLRLKTTSMIDEPKIKKGLIDAGMKAGYEGMLDIKRMGNC